MGFEIKWINGKLETKKIKNTWSRKEKIDYLIKDHKIDSKFFTYLSLCLGLFLTIFIFSIDKTTFLSFSLIKQVWLMFALLGIAIGFIAARIISKLHQHQVEVLDILKGGKE